MLDLLPAISAEEEMDCLITDLGCILQIVADHLADLCASVWKVHEDCCLATNLSEVVLNCTDY